jgi:hypothetical protein
MRLEWSKDILIPVGAKSSLSTRQNKITKMDTSIIYAAIIVLKKEVAANGCLKRCTTTR